MSRQGHERYIPQSGWEFFPYPTGQLGRGQGIDAPKIATTRIVDLIVRHRQWPGIM